MPTGYTARLCDGKQSFEDFVMSCARAFGALVTMRDDDANAAIPQEFKPSVYHRDAHEEAARKLAKFEAMTEAEADQLAKEAYSQAIAEWQKSRDDRAKRRDRLDSMRWDVKAWTPPTPEHQGLKSFMLEQLDTTIQFDCNGDGYPKPRLLSGADFKLDGVEKAIADVAYHRAEYAKEVERCAGRTEWVRALRESLKAGAK